MPRINLPSGPVNFQDHGRGAPIVLLHANPGDSRDFSAIMPVLSEHYRVIALDWPGYGGSPAPAAPLRASAMFFYDVLIAFIKALDLPPALFIGNSVGGYAAARLAIEAPQQVAGLMLVAPAGFTPQNLLTRQFCTLQSSVFSLPPLWFARLYLRRTNALVKQALQRASTEQAKPEAVRVNRGVWKSFNSPDYSLRERAKHINQPTLLVFGKYDPVIPVRTDGKLAARRIAHANLYIAPTGHIPFLEDPEDFLLNTLPFIKATLPETTHTTETPLPASTLPHTEHSACS